MLWECNLKFHRNWFRFSHTHVDSFSSQWKWIDMVFSLFMYFPCSCLPCKSLKWTYILQSRVWWREWQLFSSTIATTLWNDLCLSSLWISLMAWRSKKLTWSSHLGHFSSSFLPQNPLLGFFPRVSPKFIVDFRLQFHASMLYFYLRMITFCWRFILNLSVNLVVIGWLLIRCLGCCWVLELFCCPSGVFMFLYRDCN